MGFLDDSSIQRQAGIRREEAEAAKRESVEQFCSPDNLADLVNKVRQEVRNYF